LCPVCDCHILAINSEPAEAQIRKSQHPITEFSAVKRSDIAIPQILANYWHIYAFNLQSQRKLDLPHGPGEERYHKAIRYRQYRREG